MKGRVNFDGRLSEELPIENGVKQGDMPGPTLFSLYLTAVLWYAFHDCDKAVYFRFRTTGKVFNLKRLRAETLNLSENFCTPTMLIFYVILQKICRI